MKTIQVVLEDRLEEELRTHTLRKGDLSRVVAEAIEDWLKKNRGP